MNLDNKDPYFEIIEGCISGDRLSQEKIYEKLYGKMFGVCLRYSKGKEDALDIMQDGFIKLFANIKKYNRSGSFEGWARRIMVNTAIDFYRKNKKSMLFTNSEYIENKSGEIEIENDELDFMNMNTNDIMEAVQQLSPAYRTVLNMYVVDEFTHKEIADRLGISEGTSKSNYSKAKANLKKVLEKRMHNKPREPIINSTGTH